MKNLHGSGCGVFLHHQFMSLEDCFERAVKKVVEKKTMNITNRLMFIAIIVSFFYDLGIEDSRVMSLWWDSLSRR